MLELVAAARPKITRSFDGSSLTVASRGCPRDRNHTSTGSTSHGSAPPGSYALCPAACRQAVKMLENRSSSSSSIQTLVRGHFSRPPWSYSTAGKSPDGGKPLPVLGTSHHASYSCPRDVSPPRAKIASVVASRLLQRLRAVKRAERIYRRKLS